MWGSVWMSVKGAWVNKGQAGWAFCAAPRRVNEALLDTVRVD